LHKQETDTIEALLKDNLLGLANIDPCDVTAYGLTVSIACKPPDDFVQDPRSRLHIGGSSEEVPHYVVVSDAECMRIIEQFDLGTFYTGKLDWVDDSVLSITAQSRQQWNWSYHRHMWPLEWDALRRLM
jgi:hypothetical protein